MKPSSESHGDADAAAGVSGSGETAPSGTKSAWKARREKI